MTSKSSATEPEEVLAIIAPDGGWAWLVVIGAFVCCFVVDGSIYSFGIFLNEIGSYFKEHPTKVGWAHSLLTAFSCLLGPLFCGLVNHYGFRVVGFVGGIIAATAFLTSTFVLSFAAFTIIFGVFGGMGLGLIYLPAIVVVGYYFERWRNVAAAIAVTGSALGTILFPIIMNNFMSSATWKTKFLFLMSGCLLCSIVSLLFRPIKPVRVLLTEEEELEEILYGESSSSMSIPPSVSTTLSKLSQVEKPMEREDIFLTGSVFKIPESKSKSITSHGKGPTVAGVSVISIVRPSTKSITTSQLTTMSSIHERVKFHCKDLCRNITHMTIKMLHCKLLKSPSFCLLLLNMFVYALGMYAPYLFMHERAKEIGIDRSKSQYLYTGLGIANMVGRITSGLLTIIPGATPLNVSYTSIAICGVASAMSVLCKDIYSQHAYYILFGLTCACMSSLKVPLMVEILGVENLTNGYGLSLFFYGIASFMGAPIAGAIVQLSNSYNSAYIYSGCLFMTSSILLISIKSVYRWEKRTASY